MPKLGFVTCVKLGLSCMKEIYKCGSVLDIAITLEDSISPNKSGRVFLDNFCLENKINLVKTDNINNPSTLSEIEKADLDWLFVIGWSQIVKSELLEIPKKGAIGIHPSLLPVGRGRAAIPWAILKNLKKTGVTLFKLDDGVDTGDIIDQIELSIDESTDAEYLYEKVNSAHVELISKVISKIQRDKVRMYRQDNSLATIWPGRKPEDGEINLNGSAKEAERLIRAVTRPYPGAFFFKEGKKIIIWKSELTNVKPKKSFLEFSDGFLKILDSEEVDNA